MFTQNKKNTLLGTANSCHSLIRGMHILTLNVFVTAIIVKGNSQEF